MTSEYTTGDLPPLQVTAADTGVAYEEGYSPSGGVEWDLRARLACRERQLRDALHRKWNPYLEETRSLRLKLEAKRQEIRRLTTVVQKLRSMVNTQTQENAIHPGKFLARSAKHCQDQGDVQAAELLRSLSRFVIEERKLNFHLERLNNAISR